MGKGVDAHLGLVDLGRDLLQAIAILNRDGGQLLRGSPDNKGKAPRQIFRQLADLPRCGSQLLYHDLPGPLGRCAGSSGGEQIRARRSGAFLEERPLQRQIEDQVPKAQQFAVDLPVGIAPTRSLLLLVDPIQGNALRPHQIADNLFYIQS